MWQHQSLWHINRRSVAKGVAIGLWVSFLPIPFQMLWAALLAFWFRANLPIAIILTWITNPFTFVPINFFIYQIGSWILNENNNAAAIPSMPGWHWKSLGVSAHEFFIWFLSLGKTYLVGLPIIAFGSAVLGYLAVQVTWRIIVYRQRRERMKK